MSTAPSGGGACTLKVDLAPWSDGVLVRTHAPGRSPWRTVQIGDEAGDLITSYLILNLNEPSKLADVSWIKPGKFAGVWWEMHLNRKTWSAGPKHGATTQHTKELIDFAAANGISGVLAEGWNEGWDGDWIGNRNAFSFTKPYPDYDLAGVAAYAKQKGVKLIVHNETSGGLANYERQLDSAYTLYRSLGVDAIKTFIVDCVIAAGAKTCPPTIVGGPLSILCSWDSKPISCVAAPPIVLRVAPSA